MIATEGGRFGGYGLLLSHSFNWWFKSSLFKGIGLGAVVLRSASDCSRTKRKVEIEIRPYLCGLRRTGPCRGVCYRSVRNRQRETGVRLQLSRP